MARFTDTIAALATPAGTAALAVIRISGPDTKRLAEALLGRTPPPRLLQRRDYRDRAGTLVDDVLGVFFQAPQSYTGEDSLEISCHGNPFIAQKILEDLWARGCRPAEPGEFTQRAFVNGRIDLTQAEAVVDLIHARSERALAAANQQLRGALGRRVGQAIEVLVGVIAAVEAYIDFPDEDLPVEDRLAMRAKIDGVARETGQLLATGHYGALLRDGIKTVIIGPPNAGKSSLLNRLVGRDRALVSAEPGTTRDFIEERIQLGPHFLRLIDTAGLNPAPGDVERLGIAKTLECAAEADLFVIVEDATRNASTPLPSELQHFISAANTVIALNKIDLATPPASRRTSIAGAKSVSVSALTGEGFEDLAAAVVSLAESFQPSIGDDVIAVNARHSLALGVARDCLAAAAKKLEAPGAGAAELLASDLRGALAALGEIGGKVDDERILDRLFATFCIGK